MTTYEMHIPGEVCSYIIKTLRITPKEIAFTKLCEFILGQASKQLDPQRKGIAIVVAQCMPPSHGKVRTLRETIGLGTTPWVHDLGQNFRLLGIESLAGSAVAEGGLKSNRNLTDTSSRQAGYRDRWEMSAAATPIMRAGEIAGVLLASSTQPDYFAEPLNDLLDQYAGWLALLYENKDFHPTQNIALNVLPSYDKQRMLLANFSQRVADIMTGQAQDGHPITVDQAEYIVWQQIEAELLSSITS